PYTRSTLMDINAMPDAGYSFTEWTGSAVDAGKVTDAQAASTTVMVDSTVTVTANFSADERDVLPLFFVDDNAPGDPLPGDLTVSDAQEDGSVHHPFDSIQEAIGLAEDGFVIQVQAGMYYEAIDFQGKAIEVVGLEPNDPNTGDMPVLYGSGDVPVVRLTETRSGLGAVLKGMAVVGTKGTQAGAIECTGGSPSLINCLITGHYTGQMAGGAVSAVDCNLIIMNSTIADNAGGALGGGIVLRNSQMLLLDSIVWGNTPQGTRVDANSFAASQFCTLQAPGFGQGNILEDPQFVRHGNWVHPNFHFLIMSPADSVSMWLHGDYHLKSQQGHWDDQSQAFAWDDITSPCIDAGSNLMPIGQESIPNGDRLNQGVFGGTVFASRTRAASFGIPDENLRSALMEALGIWWEPTQEDLRWVTSLYFELPSIPERRERWITDLTGLEAAVNLRSLNLRYNHVTDLSPLQGLTQLTQLNLSENELSDLSGVGTLTQLDMLDVHHNGVTDFTPLSGMKNLSYLILRDNDYQGSLAALSSLKQLEHLDLEQNRIEDIDDLRGLTRLKDLRLSHNSIIDVSALANMAELETLDLRHNLVDSISSLTGLTHLERLFLDGNPLDAQAFVDIQTIKDNNPTIQLTYDE
ncbi:MAG: leucine-rich repeat domain-containing protein, partial [Phycisphaeraceae bacterium]|nr:leucine-rich repeat domain-containing protein [Phycisphaeraceae bacterium]